MPKPEIERRLDQLRRFWKDRRHCIKTIANERRQDNDRRSSEDRRKGAVET